MGALLAPRGTSTSQSRPWRTGRLPHLVVFDFSTGANRIGKRTGRCSADRLRRGLGNLSLQSIVAACSASRCLDRPKVYPRLERLETFSKALGTDSRTKSSRRDQIRRMDRRRYMDTDEAAEYVRVSASWLAHIRRQPVNPGPRCIDLPTGRVVYDVQDLDRWMEGLKRPESGQAASSAPISDDRATRESARPRRRGRPTKAEIIARRRRT